MHMVLPAPRSCKAGVLGKCLILFWSFVLCGCGTRVPNIPEYPLKIGEYQQLVLEITRSIRCELTDAVSYLIAQDKDLVRRHLNSQRLYPWFDGWAMQGVLTLTVSEKTEVNPSATWISNPVTMLFSLTGTVDLSSQATRTDTLNFFFNVSDLNQSERMLAQPGGLLAAANTEEAAKEACMRQRSPLPSFPQGILVSSDLKFRQWLTGMLLPAAAGHITGVGSIENGGGLTHDVRFEIQSSGSINPAWKLTRWAVNGSGSLFSANRNRVHDLSVTFGPKIANQTALAGAAASQFLASQIGIAITNRLLSATPR